ncbi:MAG: DNA repair protein RecN [Thiotrichales bacterium]|nr:DNA repair protein RecN [Thiotrichales bacterium]
MLQELSIQNLALIEKLTLNFKTGFTTLTGETGAGKSILLDALGLALGERADSSLVRYHTPRADVTAQFDISQLPHIQHWLAEQDLDDEDLCMLRRTVNSEGRSKAYINGRPIPASSLKTLGNLLIDIHGQHEHQSLLSASQQLTLLDAYANHPTLIENTQISFKTWQTLNKRFETLKAAQSDFQSRLDLLNFQQTEFDDVNPLEGEFAELSEQQSQLSHANEIKQACQLCYENLEGESGATDHIQHALSALEEIVNFSPELASTIEQLNSSLIDIQEAASEVQHHAEKIELDPEQLTLLDDRLHALFGLAKKYLIEPEQLVEKHQQIKQEITQLEHSDSELETLQIEIEQAWSTYQTCAEKLNKSRQKACKTLSKTVTDAMHTLGMPNGLFDVQLTNTSPTAKGTDKTDFLVTANKGQPLQPLAKVASGGELSRISLAIQVATAEIASLPTLIFDEVDVGIGGGIAEVVGKKMQQLGQHKQILSITHLAQVASHGHNHWRIEKHTKDESTFTQVIELAPQQRVEELARMMGGLTVTEQTLGHAKEMLHSAQKLN